MECSLLLLPARLRLRLVVVLMVLMVVRTSSRNDYSSSFKERDDRSIVAGGRGEGWEWARDGGGSSSGGGRERERVRDVIRDWDGGERLGSGGSSNGAGGKKNLLSIGSIIRMMSDNRVVLDLFLTFFWSYFMPFFSCFCVLTMSSLSFLTSFPLVGKSIFNRGFALRSLFLY